MVVTALKSFRDRFAALKLLVTCSKRRCRERLQRSGPMSNYSLVANAFLDCSFNVTFYLNLQRAKFAKSGTSRGNETCNNEHSSNLRFLHQALHGVNIKAVQPSSHYAQSDIPETSTAPRLNQSPPKTRTQYPPAIMHASIVFTAVTLAATAFAIPALETRSCPVGPYKEGSSCGADCLGALKCSLNFYDVVRTTFPSLHVSYTLLCPLSCFL